MLRKRTNIKLHILLFVQVKPIGSAQHIGQTLLLKASIMKKDLSGSRSI